MSKFYAVAFGFQRGVFTDWDDCKKSITNFPRPVYKKFDSKEDAEAYLKERAVESVSLDVENEKAKTFYAVARGRVAGVFIDYNEVKKHIDKYPQPMYKKFDSYSEALGFYKKFNLGEFHDDSSKKPEKRGADKNLDDSEVSNKKRKAK